MQSVDASKPRLWLRLCQFALILVVAQLARAALTWALWNTVRLSNKQVLWSQLSAVSFIVVGALLLLIGRPSLRDLGLNWSDAPRWERAIYRDVGILLVVLVASPVILRVGSPMLNIYWALIIPAFEELLFRGYGWARIQGALAVQHSGRVTWLLMSGLFGVWHLGYVDSLLRVSPYLSGETTLASMMALKIMAGVILGLLAGLIRWRSGRVYGSFLLHAMWNIASW
jgi:CAAX protease family protein